MKLYVAISVYDINQAPLIISNKYKKVEAWFYGQEKYKAVICLEYLMNLAYEIKNQFYLRKPIKPFESQIFDPSLWHYRILLDQDIIAKDKLKS